MEYPPPNNQERSFVDESRALDRDDLLLINEKVKRWKFAPTLLRGFVAFALVAVLVFQLFMMEFSWFNLLFPVFLLLFWGVGEYLLRRLFNKLKTDLQNGQKRVICGRLDDRREDHSSSGGVGGGELTGTDYKSSYFWIIDGIRISVSKEEYHRANEGDQVQVSMLPVSKVVFEARRIGE